MKRVDIGLCVLINDAVGNEDRAALVSGTDTVKSETSRKTGHGTKETLKGLREVVGNVVLVNLERVRYQIYKKRHKEALTWIIVHQEFSSFCNFVSPQIPIMLESSMEAATRRFSD